MAERLNIPITELADADPRDLKLEVGPLVTGDLRPYFGRQITHRAKDGKAARMPMTFGAICGARSARLKVTVCDRAVSCVLCMASKRVGG